MKYIVYGLVCTMLLVSMVAMILTLQGRSLRQSEAEHALTESVDAALSNLMEEKIYPIENADLFAADLLQSLLVQTNSKSDLTVSVLEADAVHGILSVEITESYQHPNGDKGTVSAYRTVIFDREVEEEKESFKVNFYVADQKLYKSYTILGQGYCSMPAPPKEEGKNFKCWRFVSGAAGVAESFLLHSENTGRDRKVVAAQGNPLEITRDISLVAVFE